LRRAGRRVKKSFKNQSSEHIQTKTNELEKLIVEAASETNYCFGN